MAVVSLLSELGIAQTGRDRPAARVAEAVRPILDLRSPERSPFPSDAFTVADANQNDPHEEKNFAMERPDRVQELRASIDRWWRVPDAVPENRSPGDQEP